MHPLTEFLARPIYRTGENPSHPNWDSWTLDYELLHQLTLKALLEDIPEFMSGLIPTAKAKRKVEIEPFGGAYDLAAHAGRTTVVFEIKVWSKLYLDQIKRQTARAVEDKHKLYYILLGRVGTEWSRKDIQMDTEGIGANIGYKEIVASLDEVCNLRNNHPGAAELAKAYHAALLDQRQRIIESWPDPDT